MALIKCTGAAMFLHDRNVRPVLLRSTIDTMTELLRAVPPEYGLPASRLGRVPASANDWFTIRQQYKRCVVVQPPRVVGEDFIHTHMF